MARVTVVWYEGGKRYLHTFPVYSRLDNEGFGVRFYPYDLPLINLQVIDGRVIDTKTKEDIGSYNNVRRKIQIEKDIRPLSTTARNKNE